MKWFAALVLISSLSAHAGSDLFSTFKEGLYGSKSITCGRTVVVNRTQQKIYLELAGNPVHGFDCDSVSIPVDEATCPDLTGQNCKISRHSRLDLLSDSMFVYHAPNGEKIIYRWFSE